MRFLLLLSCCAAAAAIAPTAFAQSGAQSYASPPRPIPYSQLDAYLRASPRERASRDWWSEAAPTAPSRNISGQLAPGRSGTAGIPGDTSVGLELRNETPRGATSTLPPSQGGGVVTNPTRDTATGEPLPEALNGAADTPAIPRP